MMWIFYRGWTKMEGNKKFKSYFVYTALCLAVFIGGLAIQYHEKTYKSFSFEKGDNSDFTEVEKNRKPEEEYRGIFKETEAFAQTKSDELVTDNFPDSEQSSAVFENETKDLYIDINTNEISELTRLYGIGEKLAKRIIDYRSINGDFEVIEDIMRVDGIGEKKFESIKDNIYVK